MRFLLAAILLTAPVAAQECVSSLDYLDGSVGWVELYSPGQCWGPVPVVPCLQGVDFAAGTAVFRFLRVRGWGAWFPWSVDPGTSGQMRWRLPCGVEQLLVGFRQGRIEFVVVSSCGPRPCWR